jgi:hypothetical protein
MKSETRDRLREKLAELRSQLIFLLTQARIAVKAQASDTELFLACDKITVQHTKDTTRVLINNVDITDAVSAVQITFKPRDYPMIKMSYKQDALKLNAED